MAESTEQEKISAGLHLERSLQMLDMKTAGGVVHALLELVEDYRVRHHGYEYLRAENELEQLIRDRRAR